MWRNSGQPVRVLMLDARACLPILTVCVYWSWTTLYIAITGFVFFSLISFLGPDLAGDAADDSSLASRPDTPGRAGLEPAAVGVSGVNLDAVERTMLVIAERSHLPFTYHDPANGQLLPVSADSLASRTGYLPAIVNAGEAIWREATGKSFELDIARDPDTLLGFRLQGIGAGSFSTVMLASLEALHQATRPGAVVVSELNAVWAAATERARLHDPEPVLAEPRGPRP